MVEISGYEQVVIFIHMMWNLSHIYYAYMAEWRLWSRTAGLDRDQLFPAPSIAFKVQVWDIQTLQTMWIQFPPKWASLNFHRHLFIFYFAFSGLTSQDQCSTKLHYSLCNKGYQSHVQCLGCLISGFSHRTHSSQQLQQEHPSSHRAPAQCHWLPYWVPC